MRAPSTCCDQATHEALKADVALFKAGTVNAQQWCGLLTAECSAPGCASTLALPLCRLCREACPSTDALPWGREDGDVAHVACVMEQMVGSARTKFVIYVGGGKAVELRRTATCISCRKPTSWGADNCPACASKIERAFAVQSGAGGVA